MAIRQPWGTSIDSDFFGGLTTLTKINATAAGSKTRTIEANVNFLRIATASKGKNLVFTADAELPAGAIVYVSAQSASSEITLGTGFAGQSFINSATAAVGTGNWIATFMYDGTSFRAISKPGRVDTRTNV